MTDAVMEMAELDEMAKERIRFEQVMSAQAQPRDLLSLFDKLVVSVRFSDEVKPSCFGRLVQESAARVSDRQVPSFLEAIERTGAATQVRSVMSESDADSLLRKAVRRALESAGMDGDKLLAVLRYLERVKLSMDMGHTVDLAMKSGMSEEVLGTICDLTFHGYYGYPKTPAKAPELAKA